MLHLIRNKYVEFKYIVTLKLVQGKSDALIFINMVKKTSIYFNLNHILFNYKQMNGIRQLAKPI